MSRDVLLLVEHRNGAPDPLSYQLVDQARELALSSRGRVSALLLCGKGAGVAERLEGAGLQAIHRVEGEGLAAYSPEAFAKVAAAAVRHLEPRLFLCGHTFQGMDVAPWVAAALRVPLLPNCLELRFEGEDLVAERLVYGQAWQARLRLPWRGTVVASLARRGGPLAANSRGSAPPIEPLPIDPSSLGIRTAVTGAIRPEPGGVDISRAEVVVGVGRGIRDRPKLAVVEDLAEALGGVVACSRPLVDLEWMPHERQVGASGKAIRPKLYIACGISGAAQHLAGITEAQTIVAINRDPNAPIFRVAHYGVVADLLEVVPRLAAEARRRRVARSSR